MSCKITLIGAGSVVFAKRLISDILQFPELADATICLMDIDPARLKVAEAMTRSIIQVLRVPARVEATLNQRDAVRGAKYVICTIQVGGYKPGTVIDFEIPAKYGVRQTIADTLGVGGVFRALRTIPVINGIAKDIAEVGADNCLLLNYTNPMAMNCMAVDWEVGIPTVGLCHSVQGTSQMLASHLGLDYDNVTYQVAGINHMAFFLKFEYRGQDAYPLLFKYLNDPTRTVELVRYEMMRRTGYFVTESSEHQAEYLPYFIHHGDEMIEKFKIPINEYIRRCEAIIASWEKQERELLGGDSGQIHVDAQSHEYGSYIIHSMETNAPRVVYGNVPNTRLITNLPDGCCVELPVLVDGAGLQPTHIGNLPPQLAALCRTNINVQELTVHAALEKKREHIYHAVMLDPHAGATLTLDQIWAMCDELIEAHQNEGLLGEFEPVLKGTGRAYSEVGAKVIARLEVAQDLNLEPGAENELNVTLENPGETPRNVALRVGNATLGVQDISVKALPGQVTRETVKVRFPAGITSAMEVPLRSDDSDVLSIGASVAPYTVLTPSATKPAEFTLLLAGEKAVEGKFTCDNGVIHMGIEVQDSNIAPQNDIANSWLGSCLELFFSPATNRATFQLLVVPQKEGNKPLIGNGRKKQEIHNITASQEISPVSYKVNLQIPMEEVGLAKDAEFFVFDCVARLNALGDAHSGGRIALNGSFESYATSRHFSRVKVG